MKAIFYCVLFAGIIFLSLGAYYCVKDMMVVKNGVKITGCLKEKKELQNPDGHIADEYVLVCMYNDSIYELQAIMSVSDYKVGDSLTYYFYPNDLDASIYPVDAQFRKGTVLATVVGVLLLLLSGFIKWKLLY
ncbi:MAG: hypothetical protein V4613_00735 [Bacteroidota bacterium]